MSDANNTPINSALEILAQSTTWQVATKSTERYTVNGNATWQAQRKALGITAKTPLPEVKKAQDEFMSLKKEARKQARAIGAQLVSGENFGLKVQTWTDKKGVKRFAVNGTELVEEIKEEKASVALKAELEAKDKQLAEMLKQLETLKALQPASK